MKNNIPFVRQDKLHEPLDCGMDNLLASRIGYALIKSSKQKYGDSIDLGLILLRELNQQGFDLRVKTKRNRKP